MGEANSLQYDQIWNIEPLKEIVEERGNTNFAQSRNAQGKEEQVSSKKRSKPEVTEMDVDDSEVSKKQKITGDTEIIDLDLIKESTISPTIIQEEVPETTSETAIVNPEETSKIPLVPILQYRRYTYATATGDEFKNKQILLKHYLDQRKESVTQEQK